MMDQFMLKLVFISFCTQVALAETNMEQIRKIDKMYSSFGFKSSQEIDVESLRKMKATDYVLVDVREAKEREVSTIPGSISKKEFQKGSEKYKNMKIVAFCTIGYRSGRFVEELSRQGYKALNLKGSILMWVNRGGELINASGKTKKVHVYGDSWNILPKDYEGVW